MSPETALSTKRNEPICSWYMISKILLNNCKFSKKYWEEKGYMMDSLHSTGRKYIV